jgi:hypothetical protein
LLFPTFCFSNAAGVIGPPDEVRITPGRERFTDELVTLEIAQLGRFTQRVAEPLERHPLSSGY